MLGINEILVGIVPILFFGVIGIVIVNIIRKNGNKPVQTKVKRGWVEPRQAQPKVYKLTNKFVD